MDKIPNISWQIWKINSIVSKWIHLLSVLISKNTKKWSYHHDFQQLFQKGGKYYTKRSTEPPYRCPTLRCSWPAIWLDQLHTYRCCTLANVIRLVGGPIGRWASIGTNFTLDSTVGYFKFMNIDELFVHQIWTVELLMRNDELSFFGQIGRTCRVSIYMFSV